MKISLKQLLGLIAIAAVLCLVLAWLMKMRASDFWGYGHLGVGNGKVTDPIYYLEVRGIGEQPTIVRLVRFPSHAAAPSNALEVSHAVVAEFDVHTRNEDRWNRQCTVIVGRTNTEKIVFPLSAAQARRIFSRPGDRLKDFVELESLWKELVEPHLPDEGQ